MTPVIICALLFVIACACAQRRVDWEDTFDFSTYKGNARGKYDWRGQYQKVRAGKLVCVIGGTGRQGGSVVAALASNNNYSIRVLTRFVDGSDAQALLIKYPGITLHYADLDDVESLKTALDGCYGCFGMTLTPQTLPHENWFATELDQGKKLADACDAKQVKHLVFSTVNPNFTQASIPQFESKIQAFKYMCGKQNIETVSGIMMSYYYEDIINPIVFKPTPETANKYKIRLPLGSGKQAQADVKDFGKFVEYIFEHKADWTRKVLTVVGDLVDVPKIKQTLESKLPGKTFEDSGISLEEFGNLDMPFAKELKDVLSITSLTGEKLTLFEGYVTACKRYYPGVSNLEDWVESNIAKIREAFTL